MIADLEHVPSIEECLQQMLEACLMLALSMRAMASTRNQRLHMKGLLESIREALAITMPDDPTDDFVKVESFSKIDPVFTTRPLNEE